MNKIALRQKKFYRGARVEAISFARDRSIDDNVSIPPGTKGHVVGVDDIGTIHVCWDNGAQLGALLEDNIALVA